MKILWLFCLFTSTTAELSDLAEAVLSVPRPVIYKNSPEGCHSNQVYEINVISSFDICSHFCLWVFEGYLMLNVTFTLWITSTSEMTFELGAIENDVGSKTNPPKLTGEWNIEGDSSARPIKIHHFSYSPSENPHYFTFKYKKKIHRGNIIEYNEEEEKFKLHVFIESPDKSLVGWLDPNGTFIQWTEFDIYDEQSNDDIQLINQKFLWPKGDLPRSRGCYNWGPINDFSEDNVEKHCQSPPAMGEFDGSNLKFTESEQDHLDGMLNNGSSPCPVCDIKDKHKEYYACSKRFKSMQVATQKCSALAEIAGSILDGVNIVCTTKLQLCITFRSVTFTASKVELCPVPTIRSVTYDDDKNFKYSDTDIPDANPVIFGCVDFPVTSGLISKMNPRTQTKFVIAGGGPRVILWYITAWEYTKIALFTLFGIFFIRWCLKKPSIEDNDGQNYEEFDDAKFFEEYGEFYSDKSEEYDQDDLYNDMY